MTNSRRSRRKAASALPGTLVIGKQEILAVKLGNAGTFSGNQLQLIPTFEPKSRLGLIALQYSQYVIERSVVSYSTGTSTSTSGRVTLGWTFDAMQEAPTTIHQILQMSASRVSSVWKNVSSSMPARSPEKRRYAVLSADLFKTLSNADKQIYLPATLQVATDESAQSGLLVGTLMWSYSIRFFGPNAPIAETFETLLTAPTPSDTT